MHAGPRRRRIGHDKRRNGISGGRRRGGGVMMGSLMLGIVGRNLLMETSSGKGRRDGEEQDNEVPVNCHGKEQNGRNHVLNATTERERDMDGGGNESPNKELDRSQAHIQGGGIAAVKSTNDKKDEDFHDQE